MTRKHGSQAVRFFEVHSIYDMNPLISRVVCVLWLTIGVVAGSSGAERPLDAH
jgi:hypothetical protein